MQLRMCSRIFLFKLLVVVHSVLPWFLLQGKPDDASTLRCWHLFERCRPEEQQDVRAVPSRNLLQSWLDRLRCLPSPYLLHCCEWYVQEMPHWLPRFYGSEWLRILPKRHVCVQHHRRL